MVEKFPLHTLWVIALIAGLFPVNAWQLGCLGVSITALILWFSISAHRFSFEELSIPKSGVVLSVALFCAWAGLSLIWSVTPFVSLLGFCIFAALPLTFLGGVCVPDSLSFEKVQKILAVLFCVLGAWACIQFFFLAEIMGGRAAHPLANPNALAVVFNIGFFLSLTQVFQKKSPSTLLNWVALILCLCAMMMTGSRGGVLALCIAFLVFVIVGAPIWKVHWKKMAVMIAVMGGAFWLSTLSMYSGDSVALRVVSSVTGADADITANRMNIWAAAIGVIQDHLWLGTGIGSFFLYYNEHRTATDVMGASHAHADPLQFWAELGLPGVILFYAVLISVLLRTITALKKAAPGDHAIRLFIIGHFAALLSVAVQAHYSFPLYNLSILLLTGAVLVFWYRATDQVLKTDRVAFWPQIKADYRAAVLIISLLGVWFVFSFYLISEHFVNKARTALFEGRLDVFAAHIQTANRLGFDANARAYILAVNIPLSLLEQNTVPLEGEKRQVLFEETNFYLDKVAQFNPRMPSLYFYRARAIELYQGGNDRVLEDLYLRALEIDPVHLGARMALADFYEEAGQPDKAYAVLKSGVGYFFRAAITPEYLGRVAQMSMTRGDMDTQKKAMEALKVYYSVANRTQKEKRSGFFGKMIGQEQMPDLHDID